MPPTGRQDDRESGRGGLMLSSYRVLDLTDDRGAVAGFLLAGLGAEVIAVEPPGGHRSRWIGPFIGDAGAGGRDDPERSLTHLAFNRGKRSITVDAIDFDALAL